MAVKVVCQNRKAYHDYEIEETYEAGMVLNGGEVKSLREARASLKDGFARIKDEEAFLHNVHITPYKYADNRKLDPDRTRKLLLHKREIKRLLGKQQQRGYTLIPTKIYFKDGIAKLELALAKGKTLYDKREAIRKRDVKREMRRFMKDKSRG